MKKTIENLIGNFKHWKVALIVLALYVMSSNSATYATFINNQLDQEAQSTTTIVGAKKINPTTVEILYSNKERLTLDFYGDNIFRAFQDNSGGIMRDPESKPEAHILVDNPRKQISRLVVNDRDNKITVITGKIIVVFDKTTTLFKIYNIETPYAPTIETIKPIAFDKNRVTITIKENNGSYKNEYFYGGGVQNGRFSHKGKVIAIENQNSWTDGGVASPTPYHWSTAGYGMMWHTFKKGKYDFGATENGVVKLAHETDYLDVFFMINNGATALLNDFYQLTGNPILLPKFGFYQGHLNAYNRDYWKVDSTGILFEDGKRYKESQKDTDGIKESLNGEKNNYQFSARAVIDRYKNNDMPFGWLLPNDGYGAGYGQTDSLDGNIQNLKSLADYATKNGVEIGLWTQSDLHPKPEISALLQRDIVKEVRDAGVRVLKTDVAWVGAGYSFGLNGISDVANIMTYYGNDSRPFIISLDGWAGTQRYAGIWSGDQTGGVWEYIRFHIPTYIGSGLSGQPNITSDVDGIFGGKNPIVNTRDFQWKTFTPMELNMDGWGSNPKYPHVLGEPTTSINRWYLKLKSELMPYAYSIAKEAVNGMPMIRAMFLEFPNDYTHGKATQYQFMYGPNFLVAPIYQDTKSDDKGNDIRNGIYLPGERQGWIDYFTGDLYRGECILNNFDSPLWKLPVFVRSGSIIPLTNPNNNVSQIDKDLRIYEVYPGAESSFTQYDDDGITEQYRLGKGATTLIESNIHSKRKGKSYTSTVNVTVHPTQGDFDGFVKTKATEFRINATQKPVNVSVKIGDDKKIKLVEVNSMDEFSKGENVFYYASTVNLNKFATKGSEFEKEVINKNPQIFIKIASTDITKNSIALTVEDWEFEPINRLRVTSGVLNTDSIDVKVTDQNVEAYTLRPTWRKVTNADYYEIMFNAMLYTTIKDTTLLFDGLAAQTPYSFKIRAVNKDGKSPWTEFSATTKSNPLEFAITGIVAKTTAENQGGSGVNRLFDFDEGNMWHTKWGTNSVPFDMILDLKTINQLDKFHYLPRTGRGNGNLLKGVVYYSNDKENWIEVAPFEWGNNDTVKVFNFAKQPTARYVKISVTDGVGGFGSGRELYVFKVPNTESYLQGDINNDRLLDKNDLTSYTNYTGLRKGDADFEGYISNGDMNKNDLIDAYDISVVATQLEGGVNAVDSLKVDGVIKMSAPKLTYNPGEVIEITVKGVNLKEVNAISFALPYSPQDYDFVGVEPLNTKQMENLTNDRLHTNGVKSLYPTFVNIGNQDVIEGTDDLFVLKFKAKQKIKFDLKMVDGFLVDKNLNVIKF